MNIAFDPAYAAGADFYAFREQAGFHVLVNRAAAKACFMLYLVKAQDAFVAVVHCVPSWMADQEHVYTGEKRENGGIVHLFKMDRGS